MWTPYNASISAFSRYISSTSLGVSPLHTHAPTQPPIHRGTGNTNQQRQRSLLVPCQLSLLSTVGREIRISSGVHLLVPRQLSLLSPVGRKIRISSGVHLLVPCQLSLLSIVGQKIKTSSGVRLLAPRQLSLLSTVGREIRTSSSGMSTVYTHQCTFIVHITPNYQALSNYAVRLVRQRVDSIQYGCKKHWENF